jgi:hypothetical protein
MNTYHIDINSFYVRLNLRYKGKDYGKYTVSYFSKASDTLIAVEKNVKIKDETIKYWKKYLTNN